MTNDTFTQLNKSIKKLAAEQSFENAGDIISEVVSLLGVSVDHSDWSLFTDSNGKIASNAGWFNMADGYADRRATYTVNIDASKNLDLKVFWMNKMDKSKLSWAVALTPNYEDYGMDLGDNIGIDFFIKNDCSSVVVVLSKNHVLRTLELKTELSNTQKEIFSQWSQNFDFSNKAQVHQILWDSFDFEPVNKQFFKGISGFFAESVQYLSETKEIFSNKEAAFYTNRLIGRMVFVWFLNKKGIISKDQKYFDASGVSATEYYQNKLSSLFFNVLNTEINERSESKDLETPYLNGGLFEEKEDDKKVSSKSDVFPADYFERFYEFLNHYNFTTDESSSDYQQTAIDPEMLGRIFENLLAEQSEETGESARKAKGAFYTPRDIVDYMCRETLLQYLKSQVQTTTEHTQYIERIITAKDHDWRDQQRNYRDDIKFYKEDIIRALDSFTVLDPACGSGAFPMGMMQLLVQTYERIESRFDAKRVKKNVIKNNLFGVDIEPMAIEISRLRAWLSIIVDEDNDSRNVKPLPNLDFKFITANSLISLDDSNVGLFDNHNLKGKIQTIREEYFETGNKRTKAKLQKDFYTLTGGGQATLEATKRERQLLSYDPFILNKVSEFFDPMFIFSLEKFDAVIGNPPYVQLQDKKKIPAEVQKALSNESYKTFEKTGDMYALFYERGLELTKNESGLLCYITSNKWMRAKYGASLRQYFVEHNPLSLIDFGGFSVFESATVDTNILLIQNKENQNHAWAVHFKNDFKKGDDLGSYINKNRADLKNLSDNTWTVLNPIEQSIKDQIEKVGTPLRDWDIEINRGILTGYNRAFIIDQQKYNELIKEDSKSSEIIKPVLRGRDINKYSASWSGLYIINTHNGVKDKNIEPINIKDYPAIKKHLDMHQEKVEKRSDRGLTPYNLRNCAFLERFEEEKIVYQEIVQKPQFYFDEESYLGEASAFILNGKNIKFLTAFLNSKFSHHCFGSYYAGGGLGEKGVRYKKSFLLKLPVPKIPEEMKVILGKKVSEIQGLKKIDKDTNISSLEKEIDEMVMDLYELNEEQKEYIRNSQN